MKYYATTLFDKNHCMFDMFHKLTYSIALCQNSDIPHSTYYKDGLIY